MKTMLLVISLILMTVVSVDADDMVLKASIYKTVAADPESVVQSGSGTQVSLHGKNLFLYLSKDVNQVRFAGQGGPNVNFWSLGVGMQHRLGKHLTLTVDVGWYEPKFKEMGEPQDYYSSQLAEGLCRYLNNYLIPTNQNQPYIPDWDYYSLEYKGGIGGKLGLNFEYPLTERFTFEITAGYRYLKVQENIRGEDYDGGYGRLGEAGCWTIRKDRDFSSFMVGAVIVVRF